MSNFTFCSYNKPREASIRAVTAGVLWALDRAAFRGSLHKSTNRKLLKTLRSADLLRSLHHSQLQRLADAATEVCYAAGHVILKEVSGFVFCRFLCLCQVQGRR